MRARVRACARAAVRAGGRAGWAAGEGELRCGWGRVHTVVHGIRKGAQLNENMMTIRNNWISVLNAKQLRLYFVDHRIERFFEQRHNEFLDSVAVVLCSLVLSMLNVLQHMKITFHTRSLQFFVLGVRIYSAEGILHHDTLHDWADLRTM